VTCPKGSLHMPRYIERRCAFQNKQKADLCRECSAHERSLLAIKLVGADHHCLSGELATGAVELASL
jgi:hypothetical protein